MSVADLFPAENNFITPRSEGVPAYEYRDGGMVQQIADSVTIFLSSRVS